MSTASVDTFVLLDGHHVLMALAYCLGTLAAALAAVLLVDRLTTLPDRDDAESGGVGRVTALLVALGAAVGAPLRYLAGLLARPTAALGHARGEPGRFVRCSGALVGAAVDGHWLALLGTGFCGGLTTYSAFAVQAVQGGRRRGSAYVVMTVGGCLAAATLGHLARTGRSTSVGPCPSFLLRDVRLVPLRGARRSRPARRYDVRVADGRVVEVGPELDASPRCRGVRADGRWLIPGLWDQHVHLGQWTLASQRLDLTGTRSVEEALARVSHRLAEGPDVPVVGWGHRSASWDRQPTVSELDDVTGVRPVVLISGDGHHAWINSRRPARAAAARARRRGQRDRVVPGLPTPRARWSVPTGTSPDAYLHTLQQAAAKGVAGLVDLEFDQGV